jgi:hypothetical protein
MTTLRDGGAVIPASDDEGPALGGCESVSGPEADEAARGENGACNGRGGLAEFVEGGGPGELAAEGCSNAARPSPRRGSRGPSASGNGLTVPW